MHRSKLLLAVGGLIAISVGRSTRGYDGSPVVSQDRPGLTHRPAWQAERRLQTQLRFTWRPPRWVLARAPCGSQNAYTERTPDSPEGKPFEATR